jgi:DNA (cytosine-5)-methyltransferase 1
MNVIIYDAVWQANVERILKISFKDNPEINGIIPTMVIERLFQREIEESLIRKLAKELAILESKFCHCEKPQCNNCPVSFFCCYWRNQQKKPVAKMPFVDLFCGAGGLSCGLEDSGFYPILAVDNDYAACQTYLFNRPAMNDSEIMNADIRELIDSSSIIQTPIVVGGPPCQGFSNANRQRLSDDPRNYLYKAYKDFIRLSGASVCIMENVPGMLGYQEAIQHDFDDIGFIIKPILTNARDFGYPQNRKRVFWLGIKTDNCFQYNQMFECFCNIFQRPLTDKQFTLMDAIGDLPQLEAKTVKNSTKLENENWGYTIDYQRTFDTSYTRLINGGVKFSYLFNHRTKYNNPRDVEIYARLSPGEKSDAESIQHIMPYQNRASIFRDKFFKLEPDQPSKTITAHMYYDCHMYIHPYQARGLTPREAARIQGFPDDYLFMGLPNQWYRQIGNAVSPLVAKQVGHALAGVLTELGKELI